MQALRQNMGTKKDLEGHNPNWKVGRGKGKGRWLPELPVIVELIPNYF